MATELQAIGHEVSYRLVSTGAAVATATSPRVRLWKWELQQFANLTGLAITVCHSPPGTSTRDKIAYRLFSHTAMNWRGKPLVDLVTIVNLIGETTTAAGLRVRSGVCPGRSPMGVVISDAQMAQIQLGRHAFHEDWGGTGECFPAGPARVQRAVTYREPSSRQ